MKVIILAGGYGTRLGSLTEAIPKPMLKVGTIPIIHHIMNHFDRYGFNEFIIALGYKSWEIKNYFLNLNEISNDITIELKHKKITYHDSYKKNWKITLVETGIETMTGGRLKRISRYLDNEEDFCFTYGDGVGDINISKAINEHKKSGKLATVTATQPQGRFGSLSIDKGKIKSFKEKPAEWINAGFFVLKKKVIDRIDGDNCAWEEKPMESLASEGQFSVYFHNGFWQPMDTLREKNILETLWISGNAPWKKW